MLSKKIISGKNVLAFGIGLIGISGVTVYLLQRLSELARLSPVLSDERIFASGISVTLYLLPAFFAGIGVNIISQVLVTHLIRAE